MHRRFLITLVLLAVYFALKSLSWAVDVAPRITDCEIIESLAALQTGAASTPLLAEVAT
jgi:hypothetical protein